MPLSTTFAGLSARALGFGSVNLPGVYDSFSTFQAPLSTADTGQTWINDAAGWESSGTGVAEAASIGFLSPRSVIPFKADTTITLFDVTPGGSILFWRIDANNWCAASVGWLGSSSFTTSIYQCVAGTISTVANEAVGTTGSISVQTAGNNVSVQAFSDGSCVTPQGSVLTWTDSGTKGIGVGIAFATNSAGQGTTVGPFTAI